MRLFIFLFVFLSITVTSCRNTPAKEVETVETYKTVTEGTPCEFKVVLEELRLRDAPLLAAKTVATLDLNTIVLSTGNVSPEMTELEIKGIRRTEPWVEVVNPDGVTGWVFAGGLKVVKGLEDTAVGKILRKERLTGLFGKKRTKQILQYRHDYIAAENSKDFENVFIRGSILRDSMAYNIYEQLQIYDHNNLPELSWLEDALLGYKLGLVAQGSSYYLFQDLARLGARAKRTTGEEDDKYIEFLKYAYNNEDREEFFPRWFLKTTESQGQSLLGRGRHIEALTRLNELIEGQQLFMNPILKIKRFIIQDIVNTDADRTAYSEKSDAILNEIDTILSSGLRLLSNSDKARLERRKVFFEQKDLAL